MFRKTAYASAPEVPPAQPRASSPAQSRLSFKLIVFIATNLALLAAAQSFVGARFELSGVAPLKHGRDHKIDTQVLVNDNFWSSVQRLSDANAVWLWGVVLLLSGVWPYVKLLATAMIMHLVASGRFEKAEGYRYLILLETSGKSAYAYVFLISLYVSCFTIVTSKYTLLYHTHLQMTLGVYSETGVALLVLATLHSTIITTVCARSLLPGSLEGAMNRMEENTSETAPLRDAMRQKLEAKAATASADDVAHEILGITVTPTRRCTAAAWSAAAAFGLLFLLGWLPMIQVERGGFLGKLATRHEVDISVLNAAQVTWYAATLSGATPFLVVCLVLFLFIISVVAPALEFVALGLCAMRLLRRKVAAAEGWYLWASWCNSLDGITVIVITVLAMQWDMGRLGGANMWYDCPEYKTAMNDKAVLSLGGIGYASDKECFTMNSTLGVGFFVVLIVGLLRGLAWRLLRGLVGAVTPVSEKALPPAESASASSAGRPYDPWEHEH